MWKSGAAALFLGLAAAAVFFFVETRIDFADTGLEAAVREALGEPQGPLRSSQVKKIRVLEAGGRDIRSLEGIENLANLKVLDLVDNRVECVRPLRHLTKLEELSLRNNGITDLAPLGFDALAELPRLKHLSLRHNVVRFDDAPQVRLSDISLLGEFTGLASLELRDNHIEDIQPLASLVHLETLDISQNPLQGGDLSPLKGLTRLRFLNLRETGARDLAPLETLRELRYLNLHSNENIQSIKPLENLTGLEALILRNVPVGGEMEALAGLVNLRRLNLRNCSLTDVTVLGDLMAAGALQDRREMGIEAQVDLRENPIPRADRDGMDGYEPVRPYWENIARREPLELP